MRKKVYSIEWHREAAKQFKKIKESKLREQILNILENEIAKDPMVGKPLTLICKGMRSYRLGQLRILYRPYKDRLVVVVLKIEHRKGVYRKK